MTTPAFDPMLEDPEAEESNTTQYFCDYCGAGPFGKSLDKARHVQRECAQAPESRPRRPNRNNKATRQQGAPPPPQREPSDDPADDLPEVGRTLFDVLMVCVPKNRSQNLETAEMFSTYYDQLTRDRYSLQQWLKTQGYSDSTVTRAMNKIFGLNLGGNEPYHPTGNGGAHAYQWTPNGFMPMPIFMSGGGERSAPSYQPPFIMPPPDNGRDLDRLRDEFREQLREERERYYRDMEMRSGQLETSLDRLADQMAQMAQVVQSGQQTGTTFRRFRRPRLGEEGLIMTDASGQELYDEVEEPYDLETERLRAQMDIMRQAQPPTPPPSQPVDIDGIFNRLSETMRHELEVERNNRQRELDELKHSIELQNVRAEAERQAAEKIRLEEVRPLAQAYQEAAAKLQEAETSKDLPIEETARRDTLDRVERAADKIGSRLDTLFDKFDQQQRYAVAAQSGLSPTGRVEPVSQERQQEILNRVRERATGRAS